jgi:hypothetical protein
LEVAAVPRIIKIFKELTPRGASIHSVFIVGSKYKLPRKFRFPTMFAQVELSGRD